MEIIVYGAGEDGRKAMPFLEKEHHILFYTDRDEKKQGTFIGKYVIKTPEEIKKNSCSVIIASRKYGYEISKALQEKGISRKRLHFWRKFGVDDKFEFELWPVDAEQVRSTKTALIQYDQLNLAETENCKKVLLFCSFFSTYTKQLIENISKRYENIEFSLITRTEKYKGRIESIQLKHIYCFQTKEELKTILEKMPVYDAAQVLWIEWEWVYFHKLIREKAKRLNLNVGGSDFYREIEDVLNFKRQLIDSADLITAETEVTVQEFGDYYGIEIKKKMQLLPFGIEVLDWIDKYKDVDRNILKKKYNIPENRIVVTCGHNALKAHQHMKMIDTIEKMSEKFKREMVFVFPMTYPSGEEDYINCVSNRLQKSGLEHVILRKFMDFKEMAEYAIISDIMIHVQITDQLSSTMLEEMYAGSIVIAGKWLPYRSLHKMGMHFFDVDRVSDIVALMEEIVMNIEKYEKKCLENREIVWKHSAWDNVAVNWYALWE
ncbi:MAG: glycosyltransferase family 4 protein [Lachnospiraceae bacterium]|nr:glycosyltransferase family 4 protein [Lachnospiraceae bacterium]